MKHIRILIAEDHELLRKGVRSLLEREDDAKVVGEASDGQQAIHKATELVPDVVIMGVTMPNLNGVEATRHIRRTQPSVKVLALSMHTSHRIVAGMLQAGAAGYLVKTCTPGELFNAIRSVHRGQTYLSPDIAGGIVEDYVSRISADESSPSAILSGRERQVLQQLAEGKTTKQIALQLNRSPKTIETHRQRIMNKLELHSIAELTKYAVREGGASLES